MAALAAELMRVGAIADRLEQVLPLSAEEHDPSWQDLDLLVQSLGCLSNFLNELSASEATVEQAAASIWLQDMRARMTGRHHDANAAISGELEMF